MGPAAGYLRVVAVLAGVLHVAVLVFAFGMGALLAGAEVIGDPRASTLTGPVMAGLSAAALAGVILLRGRRVLRGQAAGPFATAVLAGVAAFAAYAVIGPLVFGVLSGEVFVYLDLAVGTLLSPFALLAAVLAGGIAATAVALLRRRVRGAGPPHWPWEREDGDGPG